MDFIIINWMSPCPNLDLLGDTFYPIFNEWSIYVNSKKADQMLHFGINLYFICIISDKYTKQHRI